MKMTVLFLVALLPGFSFADEVPVRWLLSKKGFNDCQSLAIFNERFDCGKPYAEMFDCETKEKTRIRVLTVGEIKSDAGKICNPVRVLGQILPEGQGPQ